MAKTGRIDFETILKNVCGMPVHKPSSDAAKKVDLNVLNVAWEDCARDHDSALGPCIADMTLQVLGKRLPLVRKPNFKDETWDIPMDKIMLAVGNESGSKELTQVSLTDYLEHFADYLHMPSDWLNTDTKSLLARKRDDNVLASAQACFLPVAEEGGKTKFNVCLYHYQTRKEAPAVLVILATANGTSAQIVTESQQDINVNMDGKTAPLEGQLLSEWRVEKGQTTDLDAPLKEEEKHHNVLMVIQVPLVQPPRAIPVMKGGGGGFSFGGNTYHYESYSPPIYSLMSMPEAAQPRGSMMREEEARSTTRDAIVTVGETTDKPFHELGHPKPLRIERDARFPVRVTFQFYKSTSTGVGSEDDMAMINGQFAALRNRTKASPAAAGSLVTGDGEGRTTAPQPSNKLPAWWPALKKELRGQIPSLMAIWDEVLEDDVFRNGRFLRDASPDNGARRYIQLKYTPKQAPLRAWGAWL